MAIAAPHARRRLSPSLAAAARPRPRPRPRRCRSSPAMAARHLTRFHATGRASMRPVGAARPHAVLHQGTGRPCPAARQGGPVLVPAAAPCRPLLASHSPPRRCRGSCRTQRLPDTLIAVRRDRPSCTSPMQGDKLRQSFDAASVQCLGIGMQCHGCCILQCCIAHS